MKTLRKFSEVPVGAVVLADTGVDVPAGETLTEEHVRQRLAKTDFSAKVRNQANGFIVGRKYGGGVMMRPPHTRVNAFEVRIISQ